MDTFSWTLDLSGFKETTKYQVNTVSYGDGYEQRQPQGLAPPKRTWSVQKTGKKALIDAIKAFLDNKRGVTAFLTPICDETIKAVATDVDKTPLGAGYYRLSWTLTESR